MYPSFLVLCALFFAPLINFYLLIVRIFSYLHPYKLQMECDSVLPFCAHRVSSGYVSNYNMDFVQINEIIKLCISNKLANFAANCMLAVDVPYWCAAYI